MAKLTRKAAKNKAQRHPCELTLKKIARAFTRG